MILPKIKPAVMKKWMRMEAEHTSIPAKQRTIVLKHVKEHGIKYYPALQKMERKLDQVNKKRK
jgi:hypothetical protein